jgi:threonine/homoserine/homoserine lactone efflux protein
MMHEMNILKFYLFGLTIALSVGPITLLIIQRSMSNGLISGITTAIAVALADGSLALISFCIGVPILHFVEANSTYIYLFSGGILLLLAIWIFYFSFQKYRKNERTVAAKSRGKDFISAYLLTLHNPFTIALFLGILGSFTGVRSTTEIPFFAFLLFLGSLTGQLIFASTASFLRGFFQSVRSVFMLNTLSAIGIAIFAFTTLQKV